MLIDPPDYCALPPALIYDCDDLERENYKALLQLAGWMWVCRRSKRPLRTTITELAARWRIKSSATYTRLRILTRLHYLMACYGPDSTVEITLGPRALHRSTGDNNPGEPGDNTPGEPADNNPGEPGDNTPGELADNTQGEPGNDNPGELGNNPRANSLHEKQGSCKLFARKPATNSNSDLVVVVDPDLDRLQQQQTIIAALVKTGVFSDIAARLAADPWVTEQRIAAWRANLAANPRVKSLGAVLAANLRAHWEPPALPVPDSYLCPLCHSRPCSCPDEDQDEPAQPIDAGWPAWESALAALRLQMDRSAFDSSLRGSRAILDHDRLRIVVRRPQAAAWLAGRFSSSVARTVAGFGGPSQIEFISEGGPDA